jgi:general secretion pathway protein G
MHFDDPLANAGKRAAPPCGVEQNHTVFSYLRWPERLRKVRAQTGVALINMPVLQGPKSADARGLWLRGPACQRSRVAGFTLLELLVVMVIIGLLAGFVAPRYFSQVGKSQVKAAKAQVDALDKAIEQFRLDVNRLPTTEEGLAALNVSPANEPNWAGPYLKKDVPRDPWGHPYVYLAPGTHNNDFDLMSYGKDGQPGGTGENADIGNW